MIKFLKDISPFNEIEPDSRYRLLIKTVIKYFIIYFVGLLFAYLATVIVRWMLNYKPFGDKALGKNALMLLEHYGHGFCIIVAIIFMKVQSKKGMQSLGLTKQVWQVFIGIIVSCVALAFILLVLLGFNQIEYLGTNKNLNLLKAVIFVGGYFVYSLAEETLCRGFIENRLRHRFNLHVCVWVSFALFCLPHIPELFHEGLVYGLIGLLNLLLISYIFSLMLDEFDNIYVCSGFHCVWYALSSMLIGEHISGVNSTYLLVFNIKDNIYTGNGNLSASLITVLILTFILLLFVDLVKLKKYFKLKGSVTTNDRN